MTMQHSDTSDHEETIKEDDLSLCNILSKHCRQGNTGTLFIVTKSNKACKIFIKEGEIHAINMRKYTADDAILELNKTGIKACSYNDNIKLTFSKNDFVISSHSALSQLGCNIENSLKPWSMRSPVSG